VALFFLAPWVGEYLNGNTSISELVALPVLGLLYGGGAVVIREVARRAGRGWPTIVMLGAAYGVIESGVVDTSMFNQMFQTYDFSLMTVESLGVSVYWFPYFVFIHAVWSITVPIVLIEAFVPQRRTTPWLSNVGLCVAASLYLTGALFIGWIMRTEEGLSITPAEFAGASLLAIALIVAAFAAGRSPRKIDRPAPAPIVVGIAAFVWSSVRNIVAITVMWYRDEATVGAWTGWAAEIALVIVGGVVLARTARRAGWADAHRLAVAGGLLLMYAWGAFAVAQFVDRTSAVDLIGHGVFALIAVTLLIAAASRTREIQERR